MSEIDRVKVNHNDSLPLDANNRRTPIASKDCEGKESPLTNSENVDVQSKEHCADDGFDTKTKNNVSLSPEDNARRAARRVSLWPEGKEQNMRDFLAPD